MTKVSTLALAAVFGLGLVSVAQAQNYAPTVAYDRALEDTAPALTGRSVFQAPAEAPAPAPRAARHHRHVETDAR